MAHLHLCKPQRLKSIEFARYHAGGATGTLGSGPFNGEDLIHESGNQVVTVVIQYRLGLWGMLFPTCCSELRSNSK